MLDLESAIKHCEEVAKQQEVKANELYKAKDFEESRDCIWCSKEHEQLAEWLRELQTYRETLIGRPCEVCKFHKTGSCSRWECVFEEVNADG